MVELSSSKSASVAIDDMLSTDIRQQLLFDAGEKVVTVLGRGRRTGSQNMLDFGTIPHTCCWVKKKEIEMFYHKGRWREGEAG